MATPHFGIFDHIEGIPGTPTPQLLRERLDLVRMADEAGFTGYVREALQAQHSVQL